ncbi:hypothetical protein ABE893_07120 [Enterococcus entomosocium]|uniref:hypothetical protein n=2 Tax=Enterococcus TaxID=1350 RepID=UPI003D6AC9FF
MPFLNNKFFLKRWIPFILLVLFLLGSIVFFLVLFLFPTSDIHAVEKKEDWIFYAEDNPESTFISRYVKHLPSVKANDRFVMKRKMTNDYKSPTMLLIGDHQHMTVYLDDQEIYTNDEPNDPLTLNHPGKTLSFITLPEDYVGKTLKIYVTSPFDTYSGFPAEVFFGPANALIGYVFSLSILNIYILLFTGFICIINLFYILVSFINQRRLKISSLLFSGFALTAGLEAGFSDMLGGLLFPPIVNSVMLNILSIITPMFLIGFYCTNMHFIRKYYQKWLYFHYSFGLLAILFALFQAQSLPVIMNYMFLLNITSTFVTSFAAIYEALKKNPFYVICAPWIVIAAIGHCFLYIQDILVLPQSDINWRSIIFFLLIIIFTCYGFLELFFASEGKNKQIDTADIKVRLYENQQAISPEQTLKWQQVLRTIKQRTHTVKDMLEDQQLAAAYEGLSEIEEQIKQQLTSPSVEKESLTTMLLANYKHTAAQKRITFACDGIIEPLEQLAENDRLSLIAHCLEYAIRYTCAVTDPQKRRLALRVNDTKGQLHIDCQMPLLSNEEAEKLQNNETKRQAMQADMQMLEQLCLAYQGSIRIEETDGLHLLHLTLRAKIDPLSFD